MPSVPISLATLPAHSIFKQSSRNEKGDDWELVDSPTHSLVGTKSSRLVLRDKDMIIASGSEVRICGLAGESFTVIDGAVGTYRVISLASRQKAELMV
jgi:nucleoporin NUP82